MDYMFGNLNQVYLRYSQNPKYDDSFKRDPILKCARQLYILVNKEPIYTVKKKIFNINMYEKNKTVTAIRRKKYLIIILLIIFNYIVYNNPLLYLIILLNIIMD